MSRTSIVQKRRGWAATFTLESGENIQIDEEAGNAKSTTFFQLSEIREYSNRVSDPGNWLTKNSAIILTVSLSMLVSGIYTFFGPTKPSTTDETAIAFIMSAAGAVSLSMVVRDILAARRQRGNRFVFFHRQTVTPLFSFYVDQPSESASLSFRQTLEEQIKAARMVRDEFKENDVVISEVENLAALVRDGVLSNDEFEKAKKVLLHN